MSAPLLVGHRGYPALYPENTLVGFRAALQVGARAVECDVQFSHDGEPVVIHDPDLRRTAGRRDKVAALTAAELADISVHEPTRFGRNIEPAPIPRLQQLVALLAEFPRALVFVEIKAEAFAEFSRVHCAEKVMAATRSLGDRAVIISFDADVLALAKRAGRRIGWVLSDYNMRSRLKALALSPDCLICNYRKLPSAPARLWSGTWQWFVYDITDREQAAHFHERGVEFVETWDIGAMLPERDNTGERSTD